MSGFISLNRICRLNSENFRILTECFGEQTHEIGCSVIIKSSVANCTIGLSRQMDRRCGGVRDPILGINSSHGYALRLSLTQEISRTR